MWQDTTELINFFSQRDFILAGSNKKDFGLFGQAINNTEQSEHTSAENITVTISDTL